ncbi:uncharacterized protein CIMG_12653 [Coccidioides immitis RS]|uniref:Uncharacterized protein n=1 Tax=Coccidioides immitis (strain RS) TaxID=246410 RepID=J3KLP3_COCIM|nr:uncharacterized protein CIMG_12653 [Coccidioides immitis RS]EAS37243.3 hypothetical protein CIMG_12653 [Coccidioides immitis RS]
MIKDQEIKKSESESTVVEDTTELYTTISQDENRRIMIYCQNYLQAITKKLYDWDSNIHTYIQEYTTITSTVQANERLDEFTKISWFLQELPEKLQNKIINKTKLNLSDNMLSIDFRKVVQVTIDLINQYEENKKIFKEDKIKQKEMKKLDE